MKNGAKRDTKFFLGMVIISGIFFFSHSQNLRGTVLDEDGNGIEGALVELANAELSTSSADDGSWSIEVSSGIRSFAIRRRFPAPAFSGNTLYFTALDNQDVRVSVFSLNGRFLYDALNQKVDAGFYSIDPLTKPLNAGTYALQVRIGGETSHFRMPVLKGIQRAGGAVRRQAGAHASEGLRKRTAIVDTINVSKSGYASAAKQITGYDDSVTITLEKLTADYHLPPPDPCYNQFYAEGCIPDDPNSACGGECTVANSCSPPEDASKADRPKTFICPRFMLFSSAMLQAARDDAGMYGWDEQDVPFNYGVVGHDPDIGGVDDGPSSCCQCYQIVFVQPETSSPKPSEMGGNLPYPKPLIVQSFNTAASGPKGFDVFMGAGGYGAFNSCYDDPNAPGKTTNFDEFIYDEYPYQNNGSGGISFLRYEQECRPGWPVTVDMVATDVCQDTIEALCNQALSSNPEVTEDTRRSCIQTNKVESLYHQNWEVVMVKRVRCPDNLTRVTGCRLVEDDLPLPSPDVQTPADARADGSFRDGYHTTTMQDCCKPTCAWADWTKGRDLPVDGEWNSFYSCDKNGIPITK